MWNVGGNGDYLVTEQVLCRSQRWSRSRARVARERSSRNNCNRLQKHDGAARLDACAVRNPILRASWHKTCNFRPIIHHQRQRHGHGQITHWEERTTRERRESEKCAERELANRASVQKRAAVEERKEP
jgi:hypothetical protein